MQRIVAALGKTTVALHQIGHDGNLRAHDDLVVTEPHFFGECRRTQGALEHGVHVHVLRGARLGRLRVGVHHVGEQVLIKRPPVHPDAHRLVMIDRRLHDRREIRVAMLRADIARVDPVLVERGRALRVLREQEVPVVVEVADKWDIQPAIFQSLPDLGDGLCRFVVVDSDPHFLRTSLEQCGDLIRRAGGIRRIGVGHRLHHDGRGGADRDTAHLGGDGGTTSAKAVNGRHH